MLLPLSTFNHFPSFLLLKRLRLNNLTIYTTYTNKVIHVKLLEFYSRFYATSPDTSSTRLSPRGRNKKTVSSGGGKSRSEEKLVNEKDGGINRSWLRETRGCTRWQGSRVSTRRFLHFTGFAPTINQPRPTIKPWYSRRRYTEVSAARLIPLQLSCSRPEEREERAERRQGARHKDNGSWARKTLRHFRATRSDDVPDPSYLRAKLAQTRFHRLIGYQCREKSAKGEFQSSCMRSYMRIFFDFRLTRSRAPIVWTTYNCHGTCSLRQPGSAANILRDDTGPFLIASMKHR